MMSSATLVKTKARVTLGEFRRGDKTRSYMRRKPEAEHTSHGAGVRQLGTGPQD